MNSINASSSKKVITDNPPSHIGKNSYVVLNNHLPEKYQHTYDLSWDQWKNKFDKFIRSGTYIVVK